jgi:hypothetical protein
MIEREVNMTDSEIIRGDSYKAKKASAHFYQKNLL